MPEESRCEPRRRTGARTPALHPDTAIEVVDGHDHQRQNQDQLETPPREITQERCIEYIEADVVAKDRVDETKRAALGEQQPVLPPCRCSQAEEDPEEGGCGDPQPPGAWLHPHLVALQKLLIGTAGDDTEAGRQAIGDEKVDPKRDKGEYGSEGDEPDLGEHQRRPHPYVAHGVVPQVIGPQRG